MKSHIFEMVLYREKLRLLTVIVVWGWALHYAIRLLKHMKGELTLKDNYPHGCNFWFYITVK